jgi:hypothetical protein
MAERRMFSQQIIDSDAFLEMPLSAQALYFHLSMRADDDGFVDNPKKIQRMVSASGDDLKLLIVKRYILTFDSGVIVIKHWRIHNTLRNDRYKETVYLEEKAMLEIKGNKAYTEKKELGIPNGNQVAPQISIDKNSIDKINKKNSHFIPPSLEEVQAYCHERNNSIDPEAFIAFYQSKDWKVGNQKMKDWKSAIITWEKREKKPAQQTQTKPNKFNQFPQRTYSDADYREMERKLINKGL